MSGTSLHLLAKIIAGASLLAVALPAQASGNEGEVTNKIVASTESGGPAAKDEKLICKRFADSTSRMKSIRACHTKEQWKQLDTMRY